ncbi:Scr1 family TA system antitoxin-like transcriptional regulator [Actinoplanes sp. HUAS TT8]|uniref:Scr1 family TA system antitoxin-like transcriptional regulator n=1 Tax=Actinoplanes sp. HUAS TT8 TaxID=3447453 RepID=UPI003F5214E6
MATSSDPHVDPEQPIGEALARMRRAHQLSGAKLAALVGMSQPKISRIERGRGLPDPEDVVVIARALGAGEAEVQDLRRRAEMAHDRMTDWRPAAAGLANRQRGVAKWESSAREIRDFQPAVLPGLVQIGSYVRAALLAFLRVVQPEGDELELARAVTARTERQEALADLGKKFHFVIAEAALRNRLCPPVSMLEQLGHLRELAGRPNVTFGIIADETPTAIPPQHGFTLFDDDMVVIETYNTGLLSRGGNVILQYRQVFESFAGAAAPEIGPILDKYETYYVERLTRRE